MSGFRRRAALFVLAAVSLVACTPETSVHEIPRDALPVDLYASPTPGASPAPPRDVTVYFVAGGRMAPVRRTSAGTPVDLAEFALRQLLAGPSDDERATGLTTAVPDGTEMLGVGVRDDVASVNLSREFERGAAEEVFAIRLAQVVFTVTELRRVQRVRFLIDGEVVSVVGDDGTLREGPVGRADYASVAPATPEPSTPAPTEAAG